MTAFEPIVAEGWGVRPACSTGDTTLPGVAAPREATTLSIEVDGIEVGTVTIGRDDTTVAIAVHIPPERCSLDATSEALGAVIDQLITAGVTRVVTHVAHDDLPTMRLVELVGFDFEGVERTPGPDGITRSTDRFTLLTEDRARQLAPPRPVERVEFVDITAESVYDVLELRTRRCEETLVAPMRWSLLAMSLPPLDDDGGPIVPWARAIHADDELVGFLMAMQATATSPLPTLWRLLIDRRHQRRGIGRLAVQQYLDTARAEGHPAVAVAWVEGPGSPRPFYESLGFRATGTVHDDGTIEAVCALSPPAVDTGRDR